MSTITETIAADPAESTTVETATAASPAPRISPAARPIAHDITELIGETPLLELHRLAESHGAQARILAKVEFFNPLSSVKDRIAWAIIRDAEEQGLLYPGKSIVDLTSGNTGIALAAIAAARGYPIKLYVLESTSPDKVKILRSLGAEIVPVSNDIFLDPEGIEKLFEKIVTENPDAYFTNQLANPVNPLEHYATTGPEIWRDAAGEVDFLIGGVGTGGTVSSAGRFLKEQQPDVRVIVAEPGERSLPTEENPYPAEIDGVHKVTELEDDQLPPNFDSAVVDEVQAVEAETAYATAREVLRAEGLFVGSSAGAALTVALRLARRPENAGKTVVAVIPDTGERYLSAGVFG